MEEINGFKYSKMQIKIATVFYIILAVAVITTIAGGVFFLSEIVLGTEGKLLRISTLKTGYQIVIYGSLFAGLFFLLVLFYGLFKRGRNWIVIRSFKPKITADPLAKSRIEIKIVVYLLLFLLVAIIFGIMLAVISEIMTTVSGTGSILTGLTPGQLVLAAGLVLIIFDGLCIFVIFFIKNGYYLILKLIGGLEKD